ncbi:hypothetical protein [Bradyrhizobium sp. WSM471]|uniref:hypothetical protein n=1 Tax=Bradyrhizobium sp. WSM471 TaxID=319017 RepID=UPI0012FA371E|nr:MULTISPECIES: hypothetical protein [Bradyrhizobium]UFW39955.1 hypothetical protein BcanWSM471_27595 [Bradyrhizobium canariense]
MTMPREFNNQEHNGRYRTHPDMNIGIPEFCRDLPARDNRWNATPRSGHCTDRHLENLKSTSL